MLNLWFSYICICEGKKNPFFTGDDEQSTEMAASWENEKVTEAAADGFVAIKIDTQRFASSVFVCDFFVCLIFFFLRYPLSGLFGKTLLLEEMD